MFRHAEGVCLSRQLLPRLIIVVQQDVRSRDQDGLQAIYLPVHDLFTNPPLFGYFYRPTKLGRLGKKGLVFSSAQYTEGNDVVTVYHYFFL